MFLSASLNGITSQTAEQITINFNINSLSDFKNKEWDLEESKIHLNYLLYVSVLSLY